MKKGELSRTLEALCEKVKAGEELDGLLTVPPGDEKGICAVRYFTDKGLPVVFVTEDQDRCGHLGTVVGELLRGRPAHGGTGLQHPGQGPAHSPDDR